jgi:hypothetical protein
VRALCVRQPWASLIATGRKGIELRSWRTHHRGPLVIVASASADREALRLFPECVALRGVTVALVDVLDVRLATPDDAATALREPPSGIFAWCLGNVRPLPPRAVRRQLGLYPIDDAFAEVAA